MAILLSIGIFLFIIMSSSLRIVKEYERGVKFTLGKFSGIMQPGLRMIIPLIQSWERVDMRTRVVDVPDQESMTKDNIPATINAVIYYRVTDAKKAILSVEHYQYAMSQLAQTAMRNVAGEVELDELLGKRETVSQKIKLIVDKESDPWGIDVHAVELKDIILPQDMKRVMAKQAEAEREKRAVIIKAQGEVIAAADMSKAAMVLAKAPGALHLRTLQTLNDLSSDQSNTVILGIPLEILRAFENVKK